MYSKLCQKKCFNIFYNLVFKCFPKSCMYSTQFPGDSVDQRQKYNPLQMELQSRYKKFIPILQKEEPMLK